MLWFHRYEDSTLTTCGCFTDFWMSSSKQICFISVSPETLIATG